MVAGFMAMIQLVREHLASRPHGEMIDSDVQFVFAWRKPVAWARARRAAVLKSI